MLGPALLPLTPSAELDDHSTAYNSRHILNNSNMNNLHRPPDHMDLLGEDPSEDFSMGQSDEDNSRTFNINLLEQDVVNNMEASLGLQYDPYPEDITTFDVNFHLRGLRPSSSSSLEGNVTQALPTHSSSNSLVDENDVGEEDGLLSPLTDLLEDDVILNEMRLLEIALEEGFSPEMAARLEEEGYLESGVVQKDTGNENDHSGVVTEDPSEPRHQQGK